MQMKWTLLCGRGAQIRTVNRTSKRRGARSDPRRTDREDLGNRGAPQWMNGDCLRATDISVLWRASPFISRWGGCPLSAETRHQTLVVKLSLVSHSPGLFLVSRNQRNRLKTFLKNYLSFVFVCVALTLFKRNLRTGIAGLSRVRNECPKMFRRYARRGRGRPCVSAVTRTRTHNLHERLRKIT